MEVSTRQGKLASKRQGRALLLWTPSGGGGAGLELAPERRASAHTGRRQRHTPQKLQEGEGDAARRPRSARCPRSARRGLTFFTLACSALESFSAFLASFSSCFAVNWAQAGHLGQTEPALRHRHPRPTHRCPHSPGPQQGCSLGLWGSGGREGGESLLQRPLPGHGNPTLPPERKAKKATHTITTTSRFSTYVEKTGQNVFQATPSGLGNHTQFPGSTHLRVFSSTALCLGGAAGQPTRLPGT